MFKKYRYFLLEIFFPHLKLFKTFLNLPFLPQNQPLQNQIRIWIWISTVEFYQDLDQACTIRLGFGFGLARLNFIRIRISTVELYQDQDQPCRIRLGLALLTQIGNRICPEELDQNQALYNQIRIWISPIELYQDCRIRLKSILLN